MLSPWGMPPAWVPGVLAYHKVGTPEWGGTWCSRSRFRAQLDALGRAGYHSLDLDGVRRHLRRHTDARRNVLITFDDAFESFADTAWPELERRGLHTVLFVVSGYAGRRATWDLPLPGRRQRHLGWPALRELAGRGVEMGSHTVSHRDLCRVTAERLARELGDSRHALEDGLGQEVRALSWPFGRWNRTTCAAARAAGYELGFGMSPPGRNDACETLAIPRRGVYVTDSAAAVLDKLDAARAGFRFQDAFTRSVHAVAEWSTRLQRAG